jgi:peptide/nickel transport system permease protein
MTTAPISSPGQLAGAEREFTVKARTQRQMVIRRFLAHKLAMSSLVLLLLLVVGALVVPTFWHYSYENTKSAGLLSPSLAHPFGTDTIGHDVLAQVLRGMQNSLRISLVGVAFGETLGVLFGALAGFYRGWVDSLIMRAVDVILTLPALVLALVLAQVIGSSWWLIALILGGLGAGPSARLIRSVFLSLREREFVEAARALGANDKRIIMRHLLPNAMGPLIVDLTLNIALIMLGEAALAFLGKGLQPPDVSLGFLVSNGVDTVSTAPWLFYLPGLVLIAMILSINFIGDGLRDAFDPTQQRVRA